MEYTVRQIGNVALMERAKVGFLSSRKVPPSAVMKCYDWATRRRDEGRCVAGRLLVVSPVAQTATRVDARTADIRNRYILEHSEKVVFAAIDPNGALFRLVGEFPGSQCQVLA